MRLPVARTSKRSGPLEAAGHGRTAGELCVDASFVLDSVLVLDMVMQRGRSCGSVSMKSPHHPKTSKRADGRWVVDCLECRRSARETEMPIGIGLPLQSQSEAEMLRENHVGRVNRRAKAS